jgi:beta-lactamase regulating signal transducer with metallopeptidase domain
MWFFESYIGGYVLQSVLHSMTTLFLVEMSLRVWDVGDALERFRYRLLVILMPFFMFPVFQFLNPERGSFYFIEDEAVLSGIRWLGVRLFGGVFAWQIFIFAVIATTVCAVFQELFPIFRDLFSKKKGKAPCEFRPDVYDIADELSADMDIERPSICVVEDANPIIYTLGAKEHSIVLSDSLLKRFDGRQLRSALAHELAHIARRSNYTTLLVFIVRLFMLFNPVSLLAFRRLVQDDEIICDDITVSITKDPETLASTLKAFYFDVPHKTAFKASAIRDAIETSSHNLLLKERISRLEEYEAAGARHFGWGRYIMTIVVVIALNYFVV